MGLVYAFTVPISCKKTLQAQSINVTFQNLVKQRKSARVDVPVIYGMMLSVNPIFCLCLCVQTLCGAFHITSSCTVYNVYHHSIGLVIDYSQTLCDITKLCDFWIFLFYFKLVKSSAVRRF